MADPFVAEIRIFGFNFAPRGWAFCDGQLMPISQNTALFSLLGTTYGGNGKSNFGLPDLQGSVPVHAGESPGGSSYDLGQSGGSETVTLLQTEVPPHTHAMNASASEAGSTSPEGQLFAAGQGIAEYAAPGATTTLSPQMVAPAGGDRPHNNMQPSLTLSFCIALQGVYPPRP
jgi:microcystin-dependent protein